MNKIRLSVALLAVTVASCAFAQEPVKLKGYISEACQQVTPGAGEPSPLTRGEKSKKLIADVEAAYREAMTKKPQEMKNQADCESTVYSVYQERAKRK